MLGSLKLIKLDFESVKEIVSITARSDDWTVNLSPKVTSGKIFRLSTNPKFPCRLKVGSFHGFLAIVSILEHIVGRRFCLIEDGRSRGGSIIEYLRADYMPEIHRIDRNTFPNKKQRKLPRLRKRDEKSRKQNHVPLRI